MYVTNAYVPGVSSAASLPTRGNTRVCMWVASNFTNLLQMSPGDPCYDPTLNVYTIGAWRV
jgi:hypothetical protein